MTVCNVCVTFRVWVTGFRVPDTSISSSEQSERGTERATERQRGSEPVRATVRSIVRTTISTEIVLRTYAPSLASLVRSYGERDLILEVKAKTRPCANKMRVLPFRFMNLERMSRYNRSKRPRIVLDGQAADVLLAQVTLATFERLLAKATVVTFDRLIAEATPSP